jgi:protein required for attachment to host cells
MVSNEITTWVVLAGASGAKVYEHHRHGKNFKLQHELSHPEGRLKVHDLVTDKPGHYGAGAATGAFTQDHDPKDNENTRFAKEVADYLDHARATNQFDELIVIMPPHFYGLFEKHMHDPLQKKVVRHIMKDYMNFSEHELLKEIFPEQDI